MQSCALVFLTSLLSGRVGASCGASSLSYLLAMGRCSAYLIVYVMDGNFVFICSSIILVYFIVRSGTGSSARVRSFRLLRGSIVSRAFGEFE